MPGAKKKKAAAGRQDDIKQRLEQLREEIRHHQYLYYQKNKPEISDREFDRLFTELEEMEAAHPQFADPASPIFTVGSDLDNNFNKIKHSIPVLSLKNTYNLEELRDWLEDYPPDTRFSAEWKIDGASIVLYYREGVLDKAVSRGNGGMGDDITTNVKTIRGLPLRLKDPLTIACRAEVYMEFGQFSRINDALPPEERFANPRNFVSGTLKQKHSRKVAARPLALFVYEGNISTEENQGVRAPATHEKMFRLLEKNHLPLPPDWTITTARELPGLVADRDRVRQDLPFPVDGLVIKVNDLALREDQGFTSTHPRWARAFKFETEKAVTTLEEIEVFTGRTGRVTPRARIAPVQLAGTKVTYATLHNYDYIRKLKLNTGDIVEVSKRGEIIPAVERVVEKKSKGVYSFPKTCPSCGGPLAHREESVDLYCDNERCPATRLNQLIFFCQRKQMDIEGLGSRNIEILFEEGIIQDIPDIFRLDKAETRERVLELEGFGQKKLDIILTGVKKARQENTLRKTLPSLGFRDIGHKVTEVLIDSGYNTLDKIITEAGRPGAAEKLAAEINFIGPKTAASLVSHFTNPQVLRLIQDLKKLGLRFEEEETGGGENIRPVFEGQTWCVTGSFEHFKPRDKAMAEVKKRGGRVTGSVTGKTTHLLTGEGGGSKLSKARKNNINIVSEEEFLKLIESS